MRAAARWPSSLSSMAFDDAGYRASQPSRTSHSGAGIRLGMRADPPDLHAGFPDATLVLLLEPRFEHPLLGLSKDRPSVVSITWKSTPGRDDPANRCVSSFGKRQPASSSFRPRGLSPPRRLAPSKRGACIATRFRPWGSPRFHPVRHVDRPLRACRRLAPRFPAVRSCPSKPSPRTQRPSRLSRA